MNFPRNNNGELEVSNGTYSREKVALKKCKYKDELRLFLGVTAVTPVIYGVEQPREIRRCKPFVISRTTLLSMTDF